VSEHYLVWLSKGPAWLPDVPRRRQPGWATHGAFMDALVDEGFVVLGGPVGEGDGDDALLVVRATGEAEIHERLAADPWSPHRLTTRAVERWQVWLAPPGFSGSNSPA
jgi:uncharacterized protein YciI